MNKKSNILFLMIVTMSFPLYPALERLGNWLSGGPRPYYDTYDPSYVYYSTITQPGTRYYTTRGSLPNKTSIIENNNNYVITVVLPGFNKQDVHVSAIERSIQINASGQKIEQSALANPPISSYQQTIPLRWAIIPQQVQSEYLNGVLTITAPKVSATLPEGVAVPVK